MRIRRSGVPRSTVDKWGREGVPVAVAHAVRIADALGVEVRGRGKDAVVVRGRRDGTDKWR